MYICEETQLLTAETENMVSILWTARDSILKIKK